MTQIQVRFSSVESIEHFIELAGKYPVEMDLKSGSRIVDAKSLQGVLSFGINKLLLLVVHSEECSDFMNEIRNITMRQSL